VKQHRRLCVLIRAIIRTTAHKVEILVGSRVTPSSVKSEDSLCLPTLAKNSDAETMQRLYKDQCQACLEVTAHRLVSHSQVTYLMTFYLLCRLYITEYWMTD
jgi:hypothetical protein